jgi:hypothetical protein
MALLAVLVVALGYLFVVFVPTLLCRAACDVM